MSRQRPRFWVWTFAALALGLVVRLWFVHNAPAPGGDALIYGGIAKNLILHNVYGFNQEAAGGSVRVLPTLIRLPGYPLFLAACFRLFGMENYRSAIYVQLFIDLWTCLLAAGLARRLFGTRAWSPALVAAALCPFTSNYVAVALTETLVLWTIALAFYSMRRWQEQGAGVNRWVWLIGFALSVSLLLRPDQGLLVVAVVPGMLWISSRSHKSRSRSVLHAVPPVAIACACVLLPLVPWTLRNWNTFRLFQPLVPRSAADPGEHSPAGFNLWYRTWGIEFASTDEFYWQYDGSRVELADLPNRAFALGCRAGRTPRTRLPLYSATADLLRQYNAKPLNTPEIDSRFAQLAAQRIAAAPLCYHVLLPLARLGNMLVRPRLEFIGPDRWWEVPMSEPERIGVLLYAALDIVYLAAAVLGILRGLRLASMPERIILWSTMAAVLLRAALLLTLDNSEPRYTLEFFPTFFVWIGALFLLSHASQQRTPS